MLVADNTSSPQLDIQEIYSPISSDTKSGAARVMSEAYNESCGDWSNESINTTIRDLVACVQRYHELNPARFDDTDLPFVIAEFGCATGAASVIPLKAIITAVRKIQPEMPIQVFLNDLPENHHSLVISTVSEGLSPFFEDVFIMVAGKDFTQQVFPSGSVDFAFSNMTLMILPLPPTPRTDNIFFLAHADKLESEEGQEWLKGFNRHWTAFVTNRQLELREGGQLFITTLIVDEPASAYQLHERQFFKEVATICLRNILKKHNLEDKMPSTLKTSVSMLKKHYTDVCDKEGIHVVSAQAYDVPDCFAFDYKKTRDSRVLGQKVAQYIRGWWEHVLEGGLAYEGVDQNLIKTVSKEMFEQLPSFISERADVYPDHYRVLALSIDKKVRMH